MVFTNKYFQVRKKMFFYWLFPLLTLFSLTFTGCTIGDYTQGTLYQLSSRSLSRNNPDLRTCVFDPPYSIVHFPMHHYPSNGHYTVPIQEKVTQSQFQLLHTILDYNRSSWRLFVFDENFTTDTYDSEYLQALSSGQLSSSTYTRVDGQIFQMRERLQTVQYSFGRGIPTYYEDLTPMQKEFLFNMGASLTLYLLGFIPRVYKVITPGHFELIRNKLLGPSGQLNLQGNDHIVYDERELALRTEVLNFWQRNHASGTILFIAYGANHGFSDEFSGFPFQSGHNFCLDWDRQLYQSVLP